MATKRVSIDEYLGSRGYGGVERKHFARDSGVIIKAARVPEEKRAKFDKDAGTMRFVMSAEVEDRDRDIVIQAGLDTAEFEKNPVAPWAHRAGDPPIGKWSDLTKTLTGRPKRTEGTLTLTMSDPMAQRVAGHFDAGSLCACSIGFMPKEIERREVDDSADYYYPGYIIHAADLYECSPCTIPANPAALAKAAEGGDVLSREMIEEVLDTWSIEKGVLVPRKAFEDAHRQATAERTTVVFGGKTFEAKAGPDGAPILAPVDPSEAERITAAIEKEPGVLARLAHALGLKGKTGEADPEPGGGGKKPAPEPTPEQKLKDDITKDLPALAALHDRIERRNAAAERHADVEARLSA
ncbi:HK97 family phage prohead protease [Methylobacterium sp. CM6257]